LAIVVAMRTLNLLIVVLVSSLAIVARAGDPPWEPTGDADGVKTYRREVTGTSMLAFRGEGTVDLHIARLMKIFLDTEHATEWTDMLVESKVVGRISSTAKLIYQKYDLAFPASDRDYVMELRYEIDAANKIVAARYRSVEDPRAPENDCCVRAQTLSTYWKFTAVPGENKTRAEVEVLTDPKGMLPSFVVNMIQKDWPRKSINALKARAEKPDVQPEAAYADW
jgi:hypothetical protein